MIPDGSGVKGALQHLHSSFTIKEDDDTISDITAQDGRICINIKADGNDIPLRTNNSGSE